MMKSLLYMLCFFFITVPAFATGVDSTAVQMDMTAMPSTMSMVVRMVLSLAVVLLLIWGAVHILQRLSGTKQKAGTTSHIQVLDRAYLAPKKAVYVIQIGTRSLAVGVTDNQITPLTELDAEETQAAYTQSAELSGTPTFATLLNDVRTKFSGGQAS